jgi:cellobiose-specific phosphotransferase system component IIB
MRGVDILILGPQVSVAMIEMRKAKIGAKYHCGVTDGDEMR